MGTEIEKERYSLIGGGLRLLRRLPRRIRHAFRVREMFEWEYESCERCGACFSLCYQVRDDLWVRVYGSDGGCLCLGCFLSRASKSGISVHREDFVILSFALNAEKAGNAQGFRHR